MHKKGMIVMKLTKECRGAGTIGISGHIRPDGDCIGSTMALYLYLQKAVPEAEITLFLEQPSDKFKHLSHLEEVNTVFSAEQDFDVFFAVDCNKERLGAAEPFFEKAAKTINIDHHISNKSGCGQINYVIPEASSASELVYDLIEADENDMSMEERMDIEIAKAIYTGIIHDTGVFQYSNTSPKTLQIAAKLIPYGFDFAALIEESFYQRTYVQTHIMGRALLESIEFLDGRCIVSVIDRKTMDFYGVKPVDLDGIVNQLRNIEGVHCAVFMYETGMMEYKVSMRSDEKVNVAEVASHFGGGGHVRAAGCSMQGNFHDCINNLSLYIEKELDKDKK